MASSSDKPEPAANGRDPGAAGPRPAEPGPGALARRERRIGEIVLAAAAREPEEREAFLYQITVADPDLLEEARRRLRQATELPPAFLAVPAADILQAADLAAEPGDTLPLPASAGPAAATATPVVAGAERYELGECLGRGGMSRVFRAFDRQLGRPVALKLLEHADRKTADGRLKPRIADFGIAVGHGGSWMWTMTLAGTPYYIAPERLYDDQRPVDRRSDVYSLGVTIYQLLTGELPFHHPSLPELLRQVREDPPPALSEHSLPAELEAIAVKCLAKDPDARYPSAQAVAEDLWRFLDGKPVEAHTATFTYRLARSAAHRKSLPAALLIAGILSIILLAGFALWASFEARQAAGEAEQAAGEAEKARRAVYEAEAVLDDLAAAAFDQGRYADAEPLYRRLLQVRRQRLGPGHPETRETFERLASLYRAWGRDDAEVRALLEAGDAGPRDEE